MNGAPAGAHRLGAGESEKHIMPFLPSQNTRCSLARQTSIQITETCGRNGVRTGKGVAHSVWWVGWERDSAENRDASEDRGGFAEELLSEHRGRISRSTSGEQGGQERHSRWRAECAKVGNRKQLCVLSAPSAEWLALPGQHNGREARREVLPDRARPWMPCRGT